MMNRREFLSAAAGVGTAFSLAQAAAPEKDARPNILYIMTDQQGAGMMSCTGNPWVKTPALDALAASGIRFERSYACNPVCVPSRFSLQTGLLPSSIGMGRNEDSDASTVTEEMRRNTLGNLFSRAGYDTVYGGKVHLPKTMNILKEMGYRTLTLDARDEMAKACADFIRADHPKPFFLFASFINPHDICYMALNEHLVKEGQEPIKNIDAETCARVLQEALSREDLDTFIETQCPPVPDNFEPPKGEPECITTNYLNVRPFRAYARNEWRPRDWRLHRWVYARLTEMVDREIGMVLEALRESGLEKDTLVLFTSDHGDMNASHRMEHKSVLYEESVRVPFLMSHPGHIPEGVVDESHFVSTGLDLMPTLCDYAGIDVPPGRTGRSLRPLAEGRDPGEWRSYVAAESQNGRMVRTDRYKYCLYDSGAHREFLVDMETDPGEMNNLAADPAYAEILSQHRALLHASVEEHKDPIGKAYLVPAVS